MAGTTEVAARGQKSGTFGSMLSVSIRRTNTKKSARYAYGPDLQTG